MNTRTHGHEHLVADYLARGGTITVVPDRATCGLNFHDWRRANRGMIVAYPADVAAERDRRALVAVENGDVKLVTALLNGQHDRAIKFDIEHDRLGPIDPDTNRRAIR